MLAIAQGIDAPRTLTVVVTAASDLGIALTSVSAAELSVQKPGETVTWATSLSGATATQVTLTHTFAADATDCDVVGEYRVRAWLTIPTGRIETDAFTLVVEP